MYGGSHYSQLCSTNMTPQGKAMKDAADRFGDGKTLPFTPCKKGYIPVVNGERKYACPLHNAARKRRVIRDKGRFRDGEVDLNKVFWKSFSQRITSDDDCKGLNESKKTRNSV